MGGWTKFLLGGAAGAALGFVLSRSRITTTSSRWPPSRERQTSDRAAEALTQGLEQPELPRREVPGASGLTAALGAKGSSSGRAAAEAEQDLQWTTEWLAVEGLQSYDQETLEEGHSQWDRASEDLELEISERFSRYEAVAFESATESGAELDATAPGPPTGANGTTDESSVAGTSSIDAEDLRTRIEESRRRIRQELEEPFAEITGNKELPDKGPQGAGSEFVHPLPSHVSPHVPGHSPGLEAREGDEARSSVIPEAAFSKESTVVEPDLNGEPSPAQHVEESNTDLLDTDAGQIRPDFRGPDPRELEGSLAYDAMKARIEETRDRLKAKALEAREASRGIQRNGA